MMRNKVYISGKITGTEDYIERFAKAEELLSKNGFKGRVVNPAKVCAELPPDTTYEDYINIGISMLKMCDTIFLMKGWRKSTGACLEYQCAKALGYRILFEEYFENEKTKEIINKETEKISEEIA